MVVIALRIHMKKNFTLQAELISLFFSRECGGKLIFTQIYPASLDFTYMIFYIKQKYETPPAVCW